MPTPETNNEQKKQATPEVAPKIQTLDALRKSIEDQQKTTPEKKMEEIVADKLKGLDEASRDLIHDETKALEKKDGVLAEKSIEKELLKQLNAEKLNAVKKQFEDSTKKPVDAEKKGMLDRAVTSFQEATKGYIPQTTDMSKWTDKEKVTMATVTLGIASLAALWYFNRKGDKSEGAAAEEKAEKKSGWKKLLWIPVIGAALYYFKDSALLSGIQNKLKGWFGMGKEKIKEKAKDAKDAAKDLINGKGEEYGISNEAYEDAENQYRTHGLNAKDKIASIFGLKPGETNPQFEKFMEKMKKHDAETSEGINRVPASVALRNYESQLQDALTEMESWAEGHIFEIGVATLLAARLGILQAVLRGAGTVISKSAQIGKLMLQWGIKHPFKSLFLAGGAFIALKGIKDNVSLPENLQQFSKACKNNQPIAKGSADQYQQASLISLKGHIEALGEIGDEWGPWIGQQLENILGEVGNQLPDIVGLTPEELIQKNNAEGIDQLRKALTMGIESVRRDTEKRDNGDGKKFEKAMELLDAFEIAFVNARCIEPPDKDESDAVFAELTKALEEVGISVTVKDGIVKWGTALGEWDLCIDPSIKDKNEQKKLSEKIREKGESFATHLLFNAIDQARERQQQGMEKIPGNRALAMIIGNLVYIVEDWDIKEAGAKTINYICVPLNLFTDAVGIGPVVGNDMDKSNNAVEWGTNLTTGFLTSALFTINAAWLAAAKRLAIGGGPLHAGWKMRVAMNVIPGFSQYTFLRSAYEGAQDFKMIQKFGPLWGRRLNNALAAAHIRPEWIALVETGTEAQVLDVANKSGAKLSLNADLPTKRAQLRKFLQDSMKVTEKRLADFKTYKIWKWGKAWRGGEIAYQKELYDMVLAHYGNAKEILKGNVFTIKDLQKAGMTVAKFLKDGVPVDDLLKAGISLDDLVKAGAKIDDLLKAGKTLQEIIASGAGIDDLLRAGVKEADLLAAGKTPEEIAKAMKSVKTKVDVAKTVDAGVDVAKNLDEVERLLAKAEELRKAGNLVEAEKLAAQAHEAAEGTHRSIQAARAGGKVVAPGEISRFGKCVKGLKVLAKAFGWALSLVDVYFAWDYLYNERPALMAQMERETDKSKKDLIERRITSKDVATGVDIVGAGLSVSPLWPAGLIIMVGNAGYKHSIGAVHDAEEYLTQTESDFKKMPSGRILNSVSTTTALTGRSWTSDKLFQLYGGKQEILNGNTAIRSIGYRGYFYQYAGENLPVAVPQDLSDDLKSNPDIKNLLKNFNDSQRAYFMTLATCYISEVTKGQYTLVTPEVLERATRYASGICAEHRRAIAAGRIENGELIPVGLNYPYQTLPVNSGGGHGDLVRDIDAKTHEQSNRDWSVTKTRLEMLQTEPELFQAEFVYRMVNRVRHNISLADQAALKLEGASATNARYGYAKAVSETLQRELNASKTTPLTQSDFDRIVSTLQGILSESAQVVAERVEGSVNENDAYTIRRIGGNDLLLSSMGIYEFMKNIQPEKSEQMSVNEKRQKLGEQYLHGLNVNDNGSYFTKQYGFVGNKFMYIQFDEAAGKWMAQLGGRDAMKDPSTWHVTNWGWIPGAGGADKYNDLLRNLDAINKKS